MILVSTIFLSTGLLFLFIYFLLLSLYKKKEVSFLNTFGYEIYSSLDANKRFSLYILLFIFSGISGTGIYMGLSIFRSIFLNIVSITFIFGYILVALSNIIPLSMYKYHLICYFSGAGLIASSSILLFFGKFNSQLVIDNSVISMPIVILFLLISVLMMIFILNPNNSSFYKLERTSNNGKTTYIKPRINFLALEEWTSLIILGIINILFITQIILLK